MRLPKIYNQRLQKSLLLRFGVYDPVLPAERTPIRMVPDYIEKPEYVKYGKIANQSGKIEIKDANRIRGMKRSCKLAANVLAKVEKFVEVGISTDAIDEFVHNLTIEAGAYPTPLLYKGFPKSICTSVNNVVVHGIPDLRVLQNGDIVNVDITVYFKGFHGDCSKTFLVGDVDDSEIGALIHKHAKRNKLSVVPTCLGHGIGQYFHGPPDIYHTHNRYPGTMQPGMTFTIEPAITHGNGKVVMLDDGWTVLSEDSARSAQAEHTILVTENGVEVLTK